MGVTFDLEGEGVIECRDLSWRGSAGQLVLADFELQVRDGEVYCLYGDHGAGKSVVLRLLGGLATATRGRVVVDGAGPVAGTDLRRVVVRIVGGGAIFSSLTVQQNVEFFVRLAEGTTPPPTVVQDSLRQMSVPDRYFYQRADRLSPPLPFALWCAIAAVRRASVVLCDDPTRELDQRRESLVLDCLDELRSCGKSLVVATHDLALVAAIADRVGVLAQGHKTQEFSRATFLAQHVPPLFPRRS